jgi:hypothetical protein
LGIGFSVHHRIVAAVKRMLVCSIIVLNAHAPTEKKSDESKDRFYEELK